MGAVVVTGVVVVGFAIKEALEAYELRNGRPQARPAPETRPVSETEPAPQKEIQKEKRPKPEPKGPDVPPLWPTGTSDEERRPECKPVPVRHRGGHDDHNECADKIPLNSFPGWDVRVNGKDYDGLPLATRTLWDVKTDDFEKQPPRSQDFFVRVKLPELKRERALAAACGYDFVIGVRSRAHKQALFRADPTFKSSSWIGVEMSNSQDYFNLVVYAPALVGDDERPLAVVHGMERALPGLRLGWTTSEKEDLIALH